MATPDVPPIDAVVIGRNEGARLLACLDSLAGQFRRIIYVDSGSHDGSVDAARARGAEVVALDMTQPFTAARARNAGLAQLGPASDSFVQVLDGDCTLHPDWTSRAAGFLAAQPEVAVVCGRRREEHPGASIYNRLCDAEWETPIGEALACGGDALIRRAALAEIGGYRGDLIAGEEPEMCLRLRRAGWKIWRLDAEMTRHDARMTRLGQWWQRSRRAGHAFAEGAFLHGAPPDRHWVTETRRALLWGGLLPGFTLAMMLIAPKMAALGLFLYLVQFLRLTLRFGRQRAFFLLLGKCAEAQGVFEFHMNRLTRRHRGLIEYK